MSQQLRRELLKSRGAETILLGLAGGALGSVLTPALTDVLLRLSPIELPELVDLGLGPRLLVFTLLLSSVVGAALAVGSTTMRWRAADVGSARAIRERAAERGLQRGAGPNERSKSSPIAFLAASLSERVPVPQKRVRRMRGASTFSQECSFQRNQPSLVWSKT